MAISLGEQAPHFTLFNTEKQPVSLIDFKGKNVLLLFFPQAFTSVCTEELCTVRDNIGIYSNVSAEVVGISVDSVFTLAKFKELQGYNFTLLSDFNKEVSALYDVLYDVFPALGMKGVSKRAAFIINKEGNIAYEEVLATPAQSPDFEAIKAKLASLA